MCWRELGWHIVAKKHKLKLLYQTRPLNQSIVSVLIEMNLALYTCCCHNVLPFVLTDENKKLLGKQGVALHVI